MSEEEENQEELNEELRRAKRETTIRRLDVGERQLLMGYRWSQGDSLASETSKLGKQLLYLLNAYVEAHGVTDSGQTGDTDPKIYEEVVEYLVDLSSLLEVKAKLDKGFSEWEVDMEIAPILTELEDKYSRKTNTKIYENPSLLERVMCKEILEIAPTLIAHISTIASESSRVGAFFSSGSPENIRFWRPDLMKARREG